MKKLASLFLASLICLSTAVPAMAAGSVFKDVPDNYWAKKQIEKAYSLGMVSGYSDDTYRPSNSVTGAQVMAMLVRRYCPDDINVEMANACGISGRWYDGEFYAADKNHFLDGLPFEDDYTQVLDAAAPRELLVSMLYNVAGCPEADTMVLEQFTDKDNIASYAVNGFAWAVSNGVISGTSSTTLSPKGTATRAQVAVILIRYIEKFEGSIPEYVPDHEPTYEAKNSDGTTNADYVNSINDHKKINDYPTYGSASTVNDNGYFTKADVDIEGAVLQYDALKFLNAFLAEHGKEPARWVSIDEAEEYSLARAKEAYDNFDHVRPANAAGKTGIMTGENLYQGYGSASSVIKAWDASSGHHRTMLACAGREVCIARYGTTWVLVGFSDNGIKSAVNQAAQNYYN